MQIRPQLIALINISWNHARKSCDFFFSGRKATFVHLIAKACLIRWKNSGLAGREEWSWNWKAALVPSGPSGRVSTQLSHVEWFDVRWRNQTWTSFPASSSLGHCLVQALMSSEYTAMGPTFKTTEDPQKTGRKGLGWGQGKKEKELLLKRTVGSCLHL